VGKAYDNVTRTLKKSLVNYCCKNHYYILFFILFPYINTHPCCSAKDVVFGAISKGKHVVTANKALIAAFLPELQAALAANPTVK
jgi:homoserine dehydrogenase